MNEENKAVMKVSASTPVASLAGSIVKSVEEGKNVELHACGASVLSVKLLKLQLWSRGILAAAAKDLYLAPGFTDFEDEAGEKRTMMVFKIVTL